MLLIYGGLVYRLGRKIFILERGVRLSYPLRTGEGEAVTEGIETVSYSVPHEGWPTGKFEASMRQAITK